MHDLEAVFNHPFPDFFYINGIKPLYFQAACWEGVREMLEGWMWRKKHSPSDGVFNGSIALKALWSSRR